MKNNCKDIDIFDFYKGKRVLITGHTGFKGSWMTKLLLMAGAEVTGYALEPPDEQNLFEMLGLNAWDYMDIDSEECDFIDGMGVEILESEYRSGKGAGKLTNVYGDICNLDKLQKAFEIAQPEIVIHMAAQPIVRESYRDPVGTYATNVMGTVNVLEACRNTPSVKSIVNVTTDKVYRNKEREAGYVENEELCGYDPYSNSKSCSELVTDSYRNSFLQELGVAVTTMRAGNVIGGGDFAKDRIIPDCVRAAKAGEDIIVRNPYSTRPYQHVLEPVVTYLLMAALQYDNRELAGCYNIGPNDADAVTTGAITTMFCDKWNDYTGKSIKWVNKSDGGPHEATYLKLDCTKIKTVIGWKPVWDIDMAMDRLVEWYATYAQDGDVVAITQKQIEEYLGK